MHGDDTGSADGGFGNDHLRMLGRNSAYDTGTLTVFVLARKTGTGTMGGAVKLKDELKFNFELVARESS